MAEKIRAALIGIGAMGKKYAQMITAGEVPDMVLTAVVVRKANLLEWADSLINKDGEKIEIYSDTDSLYAASDKYEAVIIATPHKTHAELAIKAFELGKHVLCDKPASITVGQAENMYKIADRENMIYGVMFHQHKYPKYIKIKNIIDSGKLGEINRVLVENSRYFRTKHYHKSGSWRSSWNGEGGGTLINQGAHILDMWQWLFGMPKTIYANIPFGKYNNFMVDDEATLTMRYDNHMTGVFILTTGEAVWEERMEIVGSKGKLLLENDTLHIWSYNKSTKEYIAQEPVNSRENMTVTQEIIEFEPTEEPYAEMLEEFAQAVIKKDSSILSSNGRQAVNQIMLTNAAYLSAWENKAVELPINAAEYDKAFEKICSREK